MDRREALRRITMLAGGTLCATSASAILSGCTPRQTSDYASLSGDEARLLDALVETIIPTTDTPGAAEAGVSAFLDDALTHVMSPEDAAFFKAGLTDADGRAGGSFAALSGDEQAAVMQDLLDNPGPERSQGGGTFFNVLRDLTLAGYFSSEIGATQVHRLQMTFPNYDGALPYNGEGAWAVHHIAR